MNPTADSADELAAFPEDELSQFELHVARRADELVKQHGSGLRRDMEFWLQAEQEMLKARGDLPTSAPACG
jgi:hypothetical protein